MDLKEILRILLTFLILVGMIFDKWIFIVFLRPQCVVKYNLQCLENCLNFPFKTVKIFLFKLSKFSFLNCKNFPFQTVRIFLFQTFFKEYDWLMCREISDRDSNSLKNHALKARIPRKAYENPKKSQSSPKNPISSINMRFNSCFETHPNKHEQNKRKKILSIHIQFSVIPNQTNEFFSFLLHILLLSFIYCSVLLANPL